MVSRRYTLARSVARGKFEAEYDQIEARLEVPVGQDIWLALRMLGNNIVLSAGLHAVRSVS